MSSSSLSVLADTLPLSLQDSGTGPAVMLLHGGAGPASMQALANALGDCRVLLPVHPGFDGTPRPRWCRRIDDLALAYLALTERLALRELTLVGNSAGGWIAAEMAARRPGTVARVVLLNAVGLPPSAETGPIADPMNLPPAELAAWSFADPSRFRPPAGPEAQAQRLANQQALRVYAGDPYMHDPSLPERLADVEVPTLVLWGEADRIVSPAYGRALSGAIPRAAFEPVPDAGHFPQVEQTALVAQRIRAFMARGPA